MRAVELLLEDHAQIERLLAILNGLRTRLRDGETVEPTALQNVVDVMLEFNDRYHHAREEQHVFPVLERYALLTMAGRLDCMPGEHQIGRELTNKLRDAVQRYVGGETDAIPEIQEAAEGYLQLLGHHMGIEEGVLFELAERVVSDEDDAAMTDELEKVARAYRESGDQARIAAALDSLQQYAPASAL